MLIGNGLTLLHVIRYSAGVWQRIEVPRLGRRAWELGRRDMRMTAKYLLRTRTFNHIFPHYSMNRQKDHA